jgi:hypothetical protein
MVLKKTFFEQDRKMAGAYGGKAFARERLVPKRFAMTKKVKSKKPPKIPGLDTALPLYTANNSIVGKGTARMSSRGDEMTNA